MSTVDEIEEAIDRLPEDSRWKPAQRLNARLWDTWDEEIESDARAGLLDDLISEVESDIAVGRLKPLKSSTTPSLMSDN